MKPFISKSFYGVINYVGAILLMTSPWFLFDHNHIGPGRAAFFLPLVFGWLQLIMAFFSNSSHGVIKVFPMQMHHILDVLGGSFLLMSPFVFTYSQYVFWPQFLLGSLFFLAGIFTKGSPILTGFHDPLREAGIWSTDSHEGRLDH
jgi:hypothetical protein